MVNRVGEQELCPVVGATIVELESPLGHQITNWSIWGRRIL